MIEPLPVVDGPLGHRHGDLLPAADAAGGDAAPRWDVFAQPSFRRLWAAGLVATAGVQVGRIGLLLHLLQQGSSVLGLALLVATKTLPGALAAPAAGLLVDRLSKRRVMIAADLVRAACLGAVVLAPRLEVIYLVAAVESLATALFDPARAAALPLVVRRRDVPRANGFDQSAATVAMVAGPLAGAALFALGGLAAAAGVNACAFAASALLLARVRVRRAAAVPALALRPLGMSDLRAGWSYLARHRAVLQLTVLFFVSMLCGGVWVPLAPSFMREVLGSPDRLLGLHLGAFGVGGLVGSLLAPRLGGLVDRGLVLFLALLVEGGQIAAYALVPDAAASAVVLLLWGGTVAVIRVSSYSILQLEVAEPFLGRVFAVVKQAENAAILLATTLAVLLSQRLTSQDILLAAGVTYCGIVVASSLTAGGRTLLAAR